MRRPGSPGINAPLTVAFARSASSARKPLKDQPSANDSLMVLAQARRPPSWQPDLLEPIAGIGQTALRAQRFKAWHAPWQHRQLPASDAGRV